MKYRVKTDIEKSFPPGGHTARVYYVYSGFKRVGRVREIIELSTKEERQTDYRLGLIYASWGHTPLGDFSSVAEAIEAIKRKEEASAGGKP